MVSSILFYCLFSALSHAEEAHPWHPFLRWLDAETKVVVSANATAAEKAVAMDVLKHAGLDPNVSLVEESWVKSNQLAAGNNHLIVVGTITDNGVFVEHPSTWLRSREQPGGAFEIRGLFYFGIGDFTSTSTGVLEPGRNPYNVELEDQAAHHGTAFTSWRWMVRMTGRTPRGVVQAVQAFLSSHMLSGVVSSEDRPLGALPFVLSRSAVTAKPPAGIGSVSGTSFQFIGWHQIDALLMSGFASETGTKPELGWRLVYRHKGHSTSKHASPHRRNTDSEILLCRMHSSDQALGAARRLVGDLGEIESEARRDVRIFYAAHEDDIVYAGVSGPYIALESLSHPEGREILLNVLQAVR